MPLETILERLDDEVRDYLRRHGILRDIIAADLGVKDPEGREPCYAMVRPDTVLITEGLVKALQTLRDVKEYYHQKGRGQGFDTALNAYGLILGSMRSLAYLERGLSLVQQHPNSGNHLDCRINLTTVSSDAGVLYKAVGRNLFENVFRNRTGGFLSRGIVYFHELGLTLRDWLAGQDPDLVAYFLKKHVRIGEDSFKGLERFKEDAGKTDPPDWLRNKGNEEATAELKRFVKMVCMYDPASEKNALFDDAARMKPLSLLLEGKPGTGKSDAISLAYAYLSMLAERKGVPCKLVMIDHSFKDAYYSRSQHNLKARLDEACDPSGIAMVVIDDVESVIANRRNTHNNEADEGILHVLLQALDSFTTDYKGNYLVIMASNYPEKIDIALKNRVTKTLSLPGPQSVEDIISVLFEVELKAYQGWLSLSEGEKRNLALLCQSILRVPAMADGKAYAFNELQEGILPEGLSGRDLNKIAEEVKGRILFLDDLDESVLCLPREEQQGLIARHCRPVGYAVIEQAIQERAASIVRRSLEKFNEDVRERKRSIKVEREAWARQGIAQPS